MSTHEVNIYIEPKIKASVQETWFKTQINKILYLLDLSMQSEVGLVITNNEVMQTLNKTYRNNDETTDVLAFSMDAVQSKKKGKRARVSAPDGILHLGELIISYPEAIVQAESKGHDIKSELLILLIHGMLHLFGYDHEQSREKAQRMRIKEREILTKLTQE